MQNIIIIHKCITQRRMILYNVYYFEFSLLYVCNVLQKYIITIYNTCLIPGGKCVFLPVITPSYNPWRHIIKQYAYIYVYTKSADQGYNIVQQSGINGWQGWFVKMNFENKWYTCRVVVQLNYNNDNIIIGCCPLNARTRRKQWYIKVK